MASCREATGAPRQVAMEFEIKRQKYIKDYYYD